MNLNPKRDWNYWYHHWILPSSNWWKTKRWLSKVQGAPLITLSKSIQWKKRNKNIFSPRARIFMPLTRCQRFVKLLLIVGKWITPVVIKQLTKQSLLFIIETQVIFLPPQSHLLGHPKIMQPNHVPWQKFKRGAFALKLYNWKRKIATKKIHTSTYMKT